MSQTIARRLDSINAAVVRCTQCPRLIRHCKKIAREKRRMFADWEYWGRPLPSFGDPDARLLIVGLAPAAHGGNRTGRMFTGDRSGDALFLALYRAGFSNQPQSSKRDDSLRLQDCRITAIVRCAPPLNKPAPGEIENCSAYLDSELSVMLPRLRVIVCLGRLAFMGALACLRRLECLVPRPLPAFRHAGEFSLNGDLTVLASYHPSQQNMFTGRFTQTMLDRIFERAKSILES